MEIVRSSIHTALGVTQPLDHALVLQAVSEHVGEDEQLDWKQQLPSHGDEVAKDVAAMANTRGGMIVYGVAEDRRTGTAAAPLPVSLEEGHQRRIRTWLATRVHPVVAGIALVPLPSPESNESGFLVLVVPESPDTRLSRVS
jgi:predicted HTH transcriptional regulator